MVNDSGVYLPVCSLSYYHCEGSAADHVIVASPHLPRKRVLGRARIFRLVLLLRVVPVKLNSFQFLESLLIRTDAPL